MSYCKYKNVYVLLMILSASQMYAVGKSGGKTFSAKLPGNEIGYATLEPRIKFSRKREIQEGHHCLSFQKNAEKNKARAALLAQIRENDKFKAAVEDDFLNESYVQAQEEQAQEAAAVQAEKNKELEVTALLHAVDLVAQQQQLARLWGLDLMSSKQGQQTSETIAPEILKDRANKILRYELRCMFIGFYMAYYLDYYINTGLRFIPRANRNVQFLNNHTV